MAVEKSQRAPETASGRPDGGTSPDDEAPPPGGPSIAFPIVGIGASAGGLEALEAFFERVPPDPGAAFVIVQHLSPEYPSIMPELLAKRAQLPIRTAEDHTPVEVNNVYVIPPNTTLTIHGGVLEVKAPRDSGRSPIDVFFGSLADDQGGNAVAIVLSGTGADGSVGAQAVKARGGMVMAQDTLTARYDSMPRSAIALGIVDHVLPAEEMPAKVLEYVTRRQSPAEPPAQLGFFGGDAMDALGTICAILRRKTGHDFSQYKPATLVRRVQRRMQTLQTPGLDAYVERLRREPAEAEQLFRDLLIGVTQFFRDPEAFTALATMVIPELIRGKGHDDQVRVWVPGCATGEEAYSIAILLREALWRLETPLTVKIFATDIDEQALETARLGRYPESIAEQMSPERLERFFVKQGSGYLIDKQIRETCLFSTHNLISDPPFSRLDLIACRNLLIYLEHDVQRRLVPLFHYALRSGGFLFLGPSESLTGFPELFRPLDKKARVFRRNDTALSPPVTFPLADGGRGLRLGLHGNSRQAQARDLGIARVFDRLLLDHYAPAAVIVNERAEVVYTSGRTAKYLELPAGATNLHVVDMARRALRPDLHTALHHVLKTRQETVHRDVLLDVNDQFQRLDLIVRPLPELGPESGLLLVVFVDVGQPFSKEEASPADLRGGAQDPLAQALEAELRTTKEHLQTTIEELETSNEQLKSANEEMLSTNEELQSTNEELQTSKEELQSINEELQTVNQELSRKVEELDRVNSDLQNIFASTHIATLFLDNDLRIKKFSETAKDVFRIIDTDLGRPITDITTTLADGDFVADVREVMATLSSKERQVSRPEAGMWYIRRIRPYRSVDNVIEGVVVTFVDISELKLTQLRAASLAAIVESSQDAIVGMELDGTIASWNAGAERLYGYGPSEVVGQPIATLRAPQDDLPSVLEQIRAGRPVGPYETVRLHKDGTPIPILVAFFPVKDPAGVVVRIGSIARDITERKRYEKALEEADRRKDEFLALLGHELRNPLVPICNAVRVLQRIGAPTTKRPVEMIERQAAHMTRLVDDLLDVARITTGKVVLRKEPLDLAALVRHQVEDWQPRAADGKIKLTVKVPPEPVPVAADPTRIAQAVGNLLHNALKFTLPGGRVSVTLARGNGAEAVLTVRDTGVGMSAETLSRMFTPFGSTRRSAASGGLGLGLALAKGMLELHGGTMQGESEGPNHGSTFTMRLPISQWAILPPAAAAPAPAAVPALPRTILLIEDNAEVAESMAALLELDGHAVTIARTGAEGVAIARSVMPEIVICDIGLPGDLDGYEVVRALRADPATAAITCIAMSGYGQASDKQRAREAGFNAHLIKPPDYPSLARLLAERPGQG